MIESVWYKLSCFGVPVQGTAEVFFEKNPVVGNLSVTTSFLNNKYNNIFCHRVMEDQSVGGLCDGCILGEFNPVDFFTKTMMPGNTRNNLGE